MTGLMAHLPVWELIHMFTITGKPISSHVQTSDHYTITVCYIYLYD